MFPKFQKYVIQNKCSHNAFMFCQYYIERKTVKRLNLHNGKKCFGLSTSERRP